MHVPPKILSRRAVIGTGVAGSAMLIADHVSALEAANGSAQAHVDPDGPAGPFPIPWLDKNGSHNQPAGPDLEPSHIYHFKGRVARCAGFSGAGTDNSDQHILFGTRTTDYGIMDGEFWAARTEQRGTFSHI